MVRRNRHPTAHSRWYRGPWDTNPERLAHHRSHQTSSCRTNPTHDNLPKATACRYRHQRTEDDAYRNKYRSVRTRRSQRRSTKAAGYCLQLGTAGRRDGRSSYTNQDSRSDEYSTSSTNDSGHQTLGYGHWHPTPSVTSAPGHQAWSIRGSRDQ